jgi:hypothetical protein
MNHLTENEARVVREFTFNILHGDNEHRDWLTEACEAFIAGVPLPKVRGGKNLPPFESRPAGHVP